MTSVAAAAAFVWLGMILAISFIETPLKFRAPGVTLVIGLGIGRLVFRVLNVVESVLAVVVVVALVAGDAPGTLLPVAVTAAVVVLAAQLAVVRPALNRRSDRVLAGETLPRSRAHLGYVALEVVKVAALVVLGVAALPA